VEDRVKEGGFSVDDRLEVGVVDFFLDVGVEAEGLEFVGVALVGANGILVAAHAGDDALGVATDVRGISARCARGDPVDLEVDKKLGPELEGGVKDFNGDEVGEETAERVADVAPGAA
jgi:hypothetical protein